MESVVHNRNFERSHEPSNLSELKRHRPNKLNVNKNFASHATQVSCSNPATPTMGNIVSRLMSFETWPHRDIPTPKNLSEAGFYYIGKRDRVKCFNCNGGLQGWEPNEEPWHEHAKWFPRCEYLHLCRGKKFVDSVAALHPQLNRPSIHNPVANWSNDANNQVTSSHLESLEEKVTRAMGKEAVGAALLLGFEEEMIRKLLKRRIESDNRGYESAEDLVGDLQNEESKNETDDSNSPMDWYQSSSSLASSSASSSSSSSPSSSRLSSSMSPTDNLQIENTCLATPAGLVLMEEIPQQRTLLSRKSKSSKRTSDVVKDVVVENCSMEPQRNFPEEETCKVCLDKRLETLFIPCNHVCCCLDCAGVLRICPICRTKITSIIKFYRT